MKAAESSGANVSRALSSEEQQVAAAAQQASRAEQQAAGAAGQQAATAEQQAAAAAAAQQASRAEQQGAGAAQQASRAEQQGAAAATTEQQAAGNGPASSALNANRLQSQLTSQEIAGGHAFEKHVLGIDNPHGPEFTGLGISNKAQFAEHIENVINNPSASGTLSNGRQYFYQASTNTIVIRNPGAVDGGTAFTINRTRYPDPADYIKTLR
jgi:filamentous hemagglutinin